MTMVGKALSWLNIQVKLQNPAVTKWETLRPLCEARFTDKITTTDKAELQKTLTQGFFDANEDVASFYDRVMQAVLIYVDALERPDGATDAVNKLYLEQIRDKDAIRHFVAGMNDKVRRQVQLGGAETHDEVYNAARKAEAALRETAAVKQNPLTKNPVPKVQAVDHGGEEGAEEQGAAGGQLPEQALQQLQHNMDQMAAKVDALSVSYKPQRGRGNRRRGGRGRGEGRGGAWRGGGQQNRGGGGRNNNSGGGGGTGGGFKCYNCGGEGHRAIDCPSPKKEYNSNAVAQEGEDQSESWFLN